MNYGGFWVRFLAYIVDSVIVTIGFLAIVLGLGLMGLELFSPALIYFIICVLYWALMHSSARQATIGKGLVGLKVTDLSGARLTPLRAIARELAKIISSLTLLIGYIIAAFTSKKQALHDFVASTVVVRAAPGKILAAVAVAVVALVGAFGLVILFGAAMFVAALGPMAGMIGGNETVVQVKPAAPTPTPTPVSTPAPVATPAPAATPQPQVAQAPAKPAAAPATPAPAAPAPQAAAPAAPAKPAPAVVPVAATPAQVAQAAPAKPAPMKEAAKPMAKEPEPAKPVVKAPEPVKEPEPMKESAAAAPPPATDDKPAAAPRKAAPAPVYVVMGPTVPGPRFNDLVTAVIYRDAKAVSELLALGKWPDKADSSGMTPLMLAASQGDGPIAEALLKAGANPNLTGPGGATAMSLARERKDAALIGLLQHHGAR